MANLDKNMSTMGRIACVELSNILDAIAILNKNVKVNLPLNNGTNDEPIIMPSKFLTNWILDFNPQTNPINYHTAGHAFSQLNKEIETIGVETKNIMMHNSGGEGGFRGRPNSFQGRGSKGGKGGFKGRKTDSSNNEDVRKMGGERAGSKTFNKKGRQGNYQGKRKRVDI